MELALMEQCSLISLGSHNIPIKLMTPTQPFLLKLMPRLVSNFIYATVQIYSFKSILRNSSLGLSWLTLNQQ